MAGVDDSKSTARLRWLAVFRAPAVVASPALERGGELADPIVSVIVWRARARQDGVVDDVEVADARAAQRTDRLLDTGELVHTCGVLRRRQVAPMRRHDHPPLDLIGRRHRDR